MSFDRQIDQLCTHEVAEEFLFVQDDRQTVSPIRPISSAASVQVRVNGEIAVPSDGVQVQARVTGTREGPFNLTASTNTLAIQINDDSVRTVVLPAATRVNPAKLASTLTALFGGLIFYTERNRIGIRTTLAGTSSTFRLDPSSTMASVFGIATNRIFRGKNAFPGWTLVSDPTTLSDRPRRLVYFDEPLQAASNYVEITYTTVRQECRRCGGTGVENDWRYGADGKINTARDEALLIQELLKITYTSRGSNPFHPWYGTTLLERIGSKNAFSGVLQNAISSDVYTTFGRWQSIKRQQEETVGQTLTDEEYPFRMMGVRLEQSQQDPTVIFLNIDVQSRSLKPIVLSRGLRLPEPIDLLGDTQTQGVFRQSLSKFTLVG